MTAIYSPVSYPYDPAASPPVDWDAGAAQRLPWPTEQLPGSRWRNLHTGTLVCVTRLGPTHFSKKPVPLIRVVLPLELAGDIDRPYYCEELGLWRGRRYLVEHYARIDLLPPAAQWAWFELEARHIRTSAQMALNAMLNLAEDPGRFSCAAANYRIQENALARRRAEMQVVRHAADRFLRRHNVPAASTLTFVVPETPPHLAARFKRRGRKERLRPCVSAALPAAAAPVHRKGDPCSN